MFFGLKDPFGLIRHETEEGLRRQVPGAVLERIETHGQPKFLTIGKKTADPAKVTVAHYAFSVQARLRVSYAEGTKREVLDSALTFMFGNVDVPGAQICRTHFDLHRDAESNFTDACFNERFLSFRAEMAQPKT